MTPASKRKREVCKSMPRLPKYCIKNRDRTFVPSLDDFSFSNFKRKRLAPVVARIELRAIGSQRSSVNFKKREEASTISTRKRVPWEFRDPTHLFVIENNTNQKQLTCSASSAYCPSWGSFPRLHPGLFPINTTSNGSERSKVSEVKNINLVLTRPFLR